MHVIMHLKILISPHLGCFLPVPAGVHGRLRQQDRVLLGEGVQVVLGVHEVPELLHVVPIVNNTVLEKRRIIFHHVQWLEPWNFKMSEYITKLIVLNIINYTSIGYFIFRSPLCS